MNNKMTDETKDGASESSDVQREVLPKRSVEVTRLVEVDTKALDIPDVCPGCGAMVAGYEEIGLVDEVMRCDADGDGFDSSINDRAFVIGVRCEECAETLVGQENVDQSLVHDLLAALKSVDDALAQVALRGTTQEKALLAARAAIARAEGRS